MDLFIGDVDVKTRSVHFYVQRQTRFTTANAVVPFELVQLNNGNAITLAGIFTAPVGGIYHFEFHGVKDVTADPLVIYLRLNSVNVAATISSNNGNLNDFVTLSLSASLNLASGDRVDLYNGSPGILIDSLGQHTTHFTGYLVEEDLTII